MSTNTTPILYVGHNKMPLSELLPIARGYLLRRWFEWRRVLGDRHRNRG